MTNKYAIANWKMNFAAGDVERWFVDLAANFSIREKYTTQMIIAPSLVHFHAASVCIKTFPNKNVYMDLAAQNITKYEQGAHTGYVGAFQARDYVRFCIVGHSERGEDRETVLTKRDLCIKHGITPIVCFIYPDDVKELYCAGAYMAWEDPNNISVDGVYKEKNPEDIKVAFEKMRKFLPSNAPLFYGGSVNRQNIDKLAKIHGLDGVLVGNASLDAVHFLDIVKTLESNSL